jgi:hypothetical protein
MAGQRIGDTRLRFGGMALLVGVLATVVTAYTIYSRTRKEAAVVASVSDDGWYDEVGV